ncbi:MAG: hypothetical protein QXP45_04175 [Thermoproteota archaeon]
MSIFDLRDAVYARLYGLNRNQLRYILDPAGVIKKELKSILDEFEELDDPWTRKPIAAAKPPTSLAKPSVSLWKRRL